MNSKISEIILVLMLGIFIGAIVWFSHQTTEPIFNFKEPEIGSRTRNAPTKSEAYPIIIEDKKESGGLPNMLKPGHPAYIYNSPMIGPGSAGATGTGTGVGF